MSGVEISAAAVVNGWLELAIANIDEQLGDGYAERNPVLVAAFVRACADQRRNELLGDDIGAGLDEIRRAIEGLAQAIDRHE